MEDILLAQMKDPGQVADAAHRMKLMLTVEGAGHVVFSPGDGTRYEFLMVDLGRVATDNPTGGNYLSTAGYLFAAPDWHMSMILAPVGFMHPSYIEGKTDVGNYTATVMAEFITVVRASE